MANLAPNGIYYETRELCHKDVYKHLAALRKSLSELKLVSKKALHDNTLHWCKEVEKIKLKKDQEWQDKISQIEAENRQLRAVIENIEKSDESKGNKQLRMWEVEREVDHLNRELDEKIIHINKLQLALAEQSKAMFELEKSFVLLYRQFVKIRQKEKR